MSKRSTGRPIHGIVLLDKRQGVSSNRALQEVRRLYNANKAGHTGSLDPLATGVLPICLGEATKVSGLLLEKDKRYRVGVQLGTMTDTGDLEGAVLANNPVPAFDATRLLTVIQAFIGAIDQVPPMYSALKHEGRKLYELARAGKTVARKARRIQIYDIKLLSRTNASLELDVHCSKGTYIRTLAEEIGHKLGCGATVSALRRLSVGEFAIDQAHTLEALQQMDESALLAQLIAVDRPLAMFPAIRLDPQQALRARQGQALRLENNAPGTVRMYEDGQFLGLGELYLDGKLAPRKLFLMNN